MSKKRFNEFNISNKFAYILIVISSFVLIGVGVYAYGGTVPPAMGHSAGEIAFSSCSFGQLFGMTSDGWGCVSPLIIDSRFTVTDNGLCYTVPSSCYAYSDYCSAVATLSPITLSCYTMDQTSLNQYCYFNRCLALVPPCDGTNSNCDDVGEIFDWTSATGYCNIHGNQIFCTCYATGYYDRATYYPAGERCI